MMPGITEDLSIKKTNEASINLVLQKIAERAAVTEHHPNGPVEEFKWLHECGALSIVLPGHPLDFNLPKTPQLLRLLKAVGKANLSVGRIFEGHVNTLYLIHLYATPEQRGRWYKEVADEGHLFGVWNTQAADGISLVADGSDFIIKGSKTFCSGAEIVNRALISGDIDRNGEKGWQLLIVNMENLPQERIDRKSWRPLGMKASGSYKVDFSDYTISEQDLLARPGTYLTQPYFNAGAIRFAAVHLGGAEAIVEHTLSYLKDLKRTADPFQQMRIYNMMSALTTGELWLNRAGKYYDKWVAAGSHDEALIAFANMTRTVIEDICIKIMDESNRCVGARGLMEPFELERLYRDLTFYLRQPAPDATRLKAAEFFIEHDFTFDDDI
ncbi:acyl-CoA dehydrogenase family protein [Pedobacter sp. CFBP9032]|uniref:acyl-CoA dehydrogenase family protein n=1 Tax=Pedobacter sp. CFBP9032 TaxID=3096539 RepID=UPI002A698A32|nr:acyl-CoA dehydrogenase family protein [Pedobacter sp. CFBP9032]MDY0904959.1 acyl-CoA dehydrogenase family protein [Pedobacter sp. CFBP9032]